MSRRLTAVTIMVVLLGACATEGERNKPDQATKQQQVADINLQLGIGYMRNGNNDLALEKLKRALEYDDNNPLTHSSIALLYSQLAEDELADRHYRRALSLDSASAITHANYGSFLCGQRRYVEAVSHYREAWENRRNRDPEMAYTAAGICMNNSGNAAQAEEYLRKALAFNPKYPLALMQMVELSHAANNHLGARAYLQRLDALGLLGPRALLLGLRTEQHLGDRDSANRYRGLLLRQYPESEEARTLQRGSESGSRGAEGGG